MFYCNRYLIFTPINFVVEFSFAVQDGAASRRGVVNEEVLLVGVLEQPELDDRVLPNVRILNGDRANLASRRQVFREIEGDGIVGKSWRVIVQIEDRDAHVNDC